MEENQNKSQNIDIEDFTSKQYDKLSSKITGTIFVEQDSYDRSDILTIPGNTFVNQGCYDCIFYQVSEFLVEKKQKFVDGGCYDCNFLF